MEVSSLLSEEFWIWESVQFLRLIQFAADGFYIATGFSFSFGRDHNEAVKISLGSSSQWHTGIHHECFCQYEIISKLILHCEIMLFINPLILTHNYLVKRRIPFRFLRIFC